MELLISYQTALLTECLITYFTLIKVLPTMFAFMPYKTTRHCMPYYTNHKNNGPKHCVCICALSDYSLTLCLITHITNIMTLTTVFAYVVYQANLATVCPITHDIHKGAPHYAIADVYSECSFP